VLESSLSNFRLVPAIDPRGAGGFRLDPAKRPFSLVGAARHFPLRIDLLQKRVVTLLFPWLRIVAGKTHRTTDAQILEPQIEKLLADGYDSVTGEVGPNLNYDEIVVYDEAAAVPNYLIVYALTPS
jgi:hypothetical protein